MQQNEPAKALPILNTCIENTTKDIKDQALFLKANALIALGKGGEARQCLSTVSENYSEMAKTLLASLGSSPSTTLNAKQ
jgi:hypothetical protein